MVSAPSQKYHRVCDILTHLIGLWRLFGIVAVFQCCLCVYA